MKFVRNWIRKLIQRIASTPFVSSAISERADLSAFKKRPTIRVISGVSAILISYIIGWPLIMLLGGVALHFDAPLIIVVGGPAAYGVSHLVFLLGMYLAGAKYSMVFFRWATRVTMVILLSHFS